MKKYLIAVNVLLKNGSIITVVPMEFEEITLSNLGNLKNKCLFHYEITKLNPMDIMIIGWSEFAD